MLDWLYEKANAGIPQIKLKSTDEWFQELEQENSDTEVIIEKAIQTSVKWNIGTGIVTGLPGVAALPITVPADVAGSSYVNMRLIQLIAIARGYKIENETTQSFAYLSFLGVSASQTLRKGTNKVGQKIVLHLIQKHLSGKSLSKINQLLGFRLITKTGSKGIINVAKMVPLIGAVIGGTWNYLETNAVAKIAKNNFPPLNSPEEVVVEEIKK